MVMRVSGSMPLATSTMTCPLGMKGAASAAVDRTNTEGTAKSRISFSRQTSATSLVKAMSSEMARPGRLGWTRLVASASTSCGNFDHTVTACPLRSSSRASATPQVPAPRMPIFFASFIYVDLV